jgi:hypothetical protein
VIGDSNGAQEKQRDEESRGQDRETMVFHAHLRLRKQVVVEDEKNEKTGSFEETACYNTESNVDVID